ncbi:MAG: flippase-like domain-containing protein [Chloroflexi bacterium]|nr:flippase-like domain-containing protein [Chloroflexota bacterium]
MSRTLLGSNRFRYILGLLLGISLLFAVARFVNLATALDRFDEYPWSQLPFVLLLSLGYFLLKALRWQYFLRAISIQVPLRRSVLIYLAGQWFAFTPAGEFVRAYLLTAYGFSFSHASAGVAVQVLFDILSLAVIGSISVFWYRQQAILILAFTAVLIVGILVFVYVPLTIRTGGSRLASGRWSVLGASWGSLYQYSRQLLSWKTLLVGLALGLLAVVVGAVVLLEVSHGYEIAMDLSQSAYIYSLSQLAGALSSLPHGLGAIEGSSIALFHYAGVDTSFAASAVILFRLCTVVWGLILGGISLLVLRTPLAGPSLSKTQ